MPFREAKWHGFGGSDTVLRWGGPVLRFFYNNGGKNGGKVFGGHGIWFYSISKSSLASGSLQLAIAFSCT